MKQDTGLWFINGKVRDGAARERVWAAFNRRVDALYSKKAKLEARHRKELAALYKERDALEGEKPYTPWVGRADSGAVPAFVEQAKNKSLL